jgi:negative regulator of flagellin synthesis FlgM
LEVSTVRAVSTPDKGAVSASEANVSSANSAAQTAAGASGQAATLVSTTALSAGKPPVDTDRVDTIKRAIQSGNYPIVPTKISDAMIAAGLLLRGPQ